MLLGSMTRGRRPADIQAQLFGAAPPPAAANSPMTPPGLFGGRRRQVNRHSEPQDALPGPVSGFGGGTWNINGSPAIPDQDGEMRSLPGGTPAMRWPDGQPQGGGKGGRMGLPVAPQEVPAPGGPLGNSTRQPFDYDAALKALAGEQWKPKWWQVGLAALADGLDGDGRPDVMQSIIARRDGSRQRMNDAQAKLMEWRYRDYERQNEADLRASNPFSSGRDRVVYDPATGQTRVVYDGAEDFELYAEELGLEPGSDAYFKAVEDYVLRSSGPSAFDRDVQMDDHRTGNDERLEGVRHGNRKRMERLRQSNRRGMVDYRNANPAPPRASGGSRRETLPVVRTPAEARRLPSGTRFKTPDGTVKVVP